MSSPSQGWKRRCLMLLNRISAMNRVVRTALRMRGAGRLTDLLFGLRRRLISNTVGVNLDISRLSLSIERRSNLHVGQFDRSFPCTPRQFRIQLLETEKSRLTFHFGQSVLLDDVGQFLPFVISLVRSLLEVVDLLVYFGESERVGASVGNSTNESSVDVFERLRNGFGSARAPTAVIEETHCILFLSRDRSRSREHKSKNGEVSLLLLDRTLERVDVERDSETIDRKDDSESSIVDHNLRSNRQHTQFDTRRRISPFDSQQRPATDSPCCNFQIVSTASPALRRLLLHPRRTSPFHSPVASQPIPSDESFVD